MKTIEYDLEGWEGTLKQFKILIEGLISETSEDSKIEIYNGTVNIKC